MRNTSGLNSSAFGNTVNIDLNPSGAGNLTTARPSGSGGTASVPGDNWTWTILDASGGTMSWPEAKTSTRAPVPGQPGRDVPIDVRAKPVKSSVGKAIANFAKKSLPGLATAVAVYELIGELGILSRPKDGETEFYKPARDAEVQFCHGYNGSESTGCHTGYGFKPSAEAVCAEVLAQREASLPMYSWTGTYTAGTTTELHGGLSAPFGYCRMRNSGSGFGWQDIVLHRTTTGEPIPERIVSEQEVADEIAGKSGWPSGSKLPQAIDTALDGGRTIDVESPEVSGPASQPGPTRQETTTNPDGTTSTKTVNTTNNFSYTDNRITVTNTTTITTNTPEGTTTTTVNETPEEADPCKVNPNRAGCADLGTPPDAEELPSRTVNVELVPIPFATNAACPAPVSISYGLPGVGAQAVALSYQPVCDALVTWVRPVILLLAAFVAAFIFIGGTKE